MDKNIKKYERVMRIKKICVIPVLFSLCLYVLSIYMNLHYDVRLVSYIRNFSFGVLFIALAGYIYIQMYSANLDVYYKRYHIDPDAFDANVRRVDFGTFLMIVAFVVSIVWIGLLLGQLI